MLANVLTCTLRS